MTLKTQINIALNRLDELKELLDSLPNNVDTWHENKLDFNIGVKYPLLTEYGELLSLLNRYRHCTKNILLLPDSIPDRCHNTLYDVKAVDKSGRPNILVNEE